MTQKGFLSGGTIEEEPELLFDKADTSAVHKEPYFGLKAYGPFDKQCNQLNIGIIAPSAAMGHIEDFIKKLQEGDSQYFAGGMRRFFRTELSISETAEVASRSVPDYEEAGKRFVEKSVVSETDVVISYIPETSSFYTNTPYYRLKAILSAHGFPSQMLTKKTITKPTFSYLNVALAIFAKSGHIPWTLAADLPETDIVIGISVSDRICDEKRVIQNRYIGYVNVFDQYGKWLFFEGLAQPYKKDEISQKISELVKRAVERYQFEKGVFPKKIHIHYWKRFSKAERDSVAQTLASMGEETRVAYTSINSDHPYRFYDLESPDGSAIRGNYALLEDSFLLSTTGISTELKGTLRRMGTPKLLHIKTEQWPEEFITGDEIAFQALALTKLNWATTSVLIREPITLTFSKQLAYLTSAITEGEWKQLQTGPVNINMRSKPWFL